MYVYSSDTKGINKFHLPPSKCWLHRVETCNRHKLFPLVYQANHCSSLLKGWLNLCNRVYVSRYVWYENEHLWIFQRHAFNQCYIGVKAIEKAPFDGNCIISIPTSFCIKGCNIHCNWVFQHFYLINVKKEMFGES